MPDRFLARLLLAGALLLACFESGSLASARFIESNQDFVSVDLATDTQVQLFQQACVPKSLVKPSREFRLENVTMLESEFFYLLLRIDYNSQLLLSLDSVDDIYALWKNDVWHYSISTI